MIHVSVKSEGVGSTPNTWTEMLINVDDIRLVYARGTGCVIVTRDDAQSFCASTVEATHKMIKQARLDRNKRESVF